MHCTKQYLQSVHFAKQSKMINSVVYRYTNCTKYRTKNAKQKNAILGQQSGQLGVGAKTARSPSTGSPSATAPAIQALEIEVQNKLQKIQKHKRMITLFKTMVNMHQSIKILVRKNLTSKRRKENSFILVIRSITSSSLSFTTSMTN